MSDLEPINTLLSKLQGKFVGAEYSDTWGLGIQIGGFSKSGNATLFITPDDTEWGSKAYRVTTRYDNIDYVKTYDDIVNVAYWWYMNYKDREPFTQPSDYWIKDFLRLGLIKEKVMTTYEPVAS